MADFAVALGRVMDNEGGYVLHQVAGDRGGMTYAGIARRRWPGWAGWAVLDGGESGVSRRMVAEFYRTEFWRPVGGDLVPCQRVADAVFDFAVNAGVRRAVKSAQSVMGCVVDGIVGPRTAAAFREVAPAVFLAEYTVRRVRYYAAICERRPDQRKFLLGWINRALRMAAPTTSKGV